MASEQFSLCWDNFHKNMSSGMNSLLENEDLVDVTLAVQGKCLKAHKMVLSVCSPYFKELFKSNPCQHPIVFMKDVSFEALSDLLQFMYQGEVQVSQENLTTFIKTAEALQIKGLTGDGNGSADVEANDPQEKPTRPIEEYKPVPRPKKQQPAPLPTPSVKRPRLSVSSDSQPLPPTITKTEPVASVQQVGLTPEPAIQFKMEPYDQNQSLLDETGDDNFGDDALDDTAGDDNEDYSMMESGVGDEEPQAGTSTDGAGEGQGIGRKPSCFFVDGYSYAIAYKSNERTYFGCSCRRSSKCKARAYIPVGGDQNELILTRGHSHPPDYLLEKKAEIWKLLKQFSITLPGKPLDVYSSVVSIFPETQELFPFRTVETSIKRFRNRQKQLFSMD
nr:protein tramtrack, beta isoform-like isoform X3 [Leptinotarsa decemlineata]